MEATLSFEKYVIIDQPKWLEFLGLYFMHRNEVVQF